MIKRRTILSAVGAAMAPGSLWPQPAAKVYRVGVMTYNLHPFDPFIPMIVDALNGRGYEEGHNLVIDHVDAKGRPERLPALAAELVARKPDVILGASNRSALHHKQASLTIPIVMVLGLGQLLVESGLVASLARPGGNVTGVIVPPDLPAGLFTTLRGVVPRLKSAALLWDPAYPVIEVADQVCARAAAAMGIRLAVLQAASKEALESALARIERDRPDALLVTGAVPMWKEGARVASFVERLRLPALYFHIYCPLYLGGLMSVAVDEDTALQQVAAIVDRIFKGERPADIPVEPARRTALVVNLKAARMIGLTLPPSFLAKADEVLH